MLKPELAGAEFRLLDLDIEAARIVAATVERCAAAWNTGASVAPTTDPACALDGADFVVITISTGGLAAMKHDLQIPERYGIYQTVGDSVGPGGWARGLRNIPVFASLAEQISRYCPNAFVLNYTNPMTTLTKTLAVLLNQPVVGLCHGLFENYQQLCKVFNLKSEDELSAQYGGLNHFFWMFDFTVRGKPGYPMLHRKLKKGLRIDDVIRDAYVDEAGHSSKRRLVASELFEEFGALPYLGDRHIAEFFGRYLTGGLKNLDQYGLVRTTYGKRVRMLNNQRKQARLYASGKEEFPRKASRETAADIMAAACTHRDFIDVMNLPNSGQIANLPMGAVVETAGVVNERGFSPVGGITLPPQILNVTLPHVLNQEMIVEAGLAGNWTMAWQALINDPQCAHLSVKRIKAMGAALLEANRDYLPQFFGRRRGNGR